LVGVWFKGCAKKGVRDGEPLINKFTLNFEVGTGSGAGAGTGIVRPGVVSVSGVRKQKQ
jgi:hypothetical protein